MYPLTPTEIEELRIAIAEEMGWTEIKPQRLTSGISDYPTGKLWGYKKGVLTDGRVIPPYTTSLDAIQQAAMERFKDEEDRDAFHASLKDTEEHDDLTHVWQLTPLDWCIAFARTAKIWRYKP